MFKQIALACLVCLALSVPGYAQIAIPNILVAGSTIRAGDLNTNFATLGTRGFDHTVGGTITGPVILDTGSLTLSAGDVTLTSPATGLTVAGVNIVNSAGKIPALSSAYFTTFTGVVALLAGPNTYTGLENFLTYTETKTAPTIVSNALTIDLSTGTHFAVSLNAAVTVTITNPPTSGKAGSFTIAFTADGTPRVITWPASVKWAGNAPPTPTSTSTKVDIYSFITYDGGTSYFAFVAGQSF